MTKDQIKAIAEGRVWDGLTAQKIGLVDQFGGIKDAVRWVATKAKLNNDYQTKIYPEFKQDFINLLYSSMQNSVTTSKGLALDNEFAKYVSTVQKILNRDRIQCRMDDICIY